MSDFLSDLARVLIVLIVLVCIAIFCASAGGIPWGDPRMGISVRVGFPDRLPL